MTRRDARKKDKQYLESRFLNAMAAPYNPEYHQQPPPAVYGDPYGAPAGAPPPMAYAQPGAPPPMAYPQPQMMQPQVQMAGAPVMMVPDAKSLSQPRSEDDIEANLLRHVCRLGTPSEAA
ncbi:hypothetical protein CYMTET_30479 [Cymbomonas tetramitiformis]|uniref:Uncharacterized protein n=1 Tax=Cymbomonas tetramitiformis TaxID=36881 RepID=A0AAE0FKA4_9CHLO|nr:hypothetical protein CYMTET_30479 [Cymbomonas tetramitiformis]